MTLIDEFRRDLALLKEGKVCWRIVAGKGTGSMVTIDFGDQIPRSTLPGRPDRPVEYRGEFCLFLKDCGWRVETPHELLSCCISDNTKGGPMLAGLTRLVGLEVVDVRINLPWMDLKIVFADGVRLRTFSFGESGSPEEFDNFCYFVPGFVYFVDANGKLRKEESNPD